MNSDIKLMVQQLMQEEAGAATERKKHFLRLVSLLCLWAKMLPPRIGGSAKGKREDRPRPDG
jgi:hypothetical protein